MPEQQAGGSAASGAGAGLGAGAAASVGGIVTSKFWLPDGHLIQLLDPSVDRWRDA